MNEVSLTVNLAGPQPRNPVAIFHLAQGFFLAGNRCLLNIDVGPGVTQCLVSPAVVNLCLAIELFLKAVIVHGGDAAPKSHKLVELIKLVSVTFRDSLRSSFDLAVPNPSFDVVIPQINEYFVKVRYGHEFNIFAFHCSCQAALRTSCSAHRATQRLGTHTRLSRGLTLPSSGLAYGQPIKSNVKRLQHAA